MNATFGFGLTLRNPLRIVQSEEFLGEYGVLHAEYSITVMDITVPIVLCP